MIKKLYWKLIFFIENLRFWFGLRRCTLKAIKWFEHDLENGDLQSARLFADFMLGDIATDRGGMAYYFPRLTGIFYDRHKDQIEKAYEFLESYKEEA